VTPGCSTTPVRSPSRSRGCACRCSTTSGVRRRAPGGGRLALRAALGAGSPRHRSAAHDSACRAAADGSRWSGEPGATRARAGRRPLPRPGRTDPEPGRRRLCRSRRSMSSVGSRAAMPRDERRDAAAALGVAPAHRRLLATLSNARSPAGAETGAARSERGPARAARRRGSAHARGPAGGLRPGLRHRSAAAPPWRRATRRRACAATATRVSSCCPGRPSIYSRASTTDSPPCRAYHDAAGRHGGCGRRRARRWHAAARARARCGHRGRDRCGAAAAAGGHRVRLHRRLPPLPRRRAAALR
jgi:hypothetical protein